MTVEHGEVLGGADQQHDRPAGWSAMFNASVAPEVKITSSATTPAKPGDRVASVLDGGARGAALVMDRRRIAKGECFDHGGLHGR